jgi:flagellar biosynthesis/type III secretory pathway M-ring protein FliF/YscJ
MSQEAESKFGKFELWHRIRKGLIAVISILFFIILCMLTIIVFIKVRTLRSKQRFEHYAEQLQENRKLIRAESLEWKRAETNNDESLVLKKKEYNQTDTQTKFLPTPSAPAVPPH